MAGVTQAYYSNAVILGLLDRKLNSFVSGNLTDVMVGFDYGRCPARAYQQRPCSDVDGPIADPREILENACDSMARIAAQLCFDQKPCNQPGIANRNAARREQPLAKPQQLLVVKSRHKSSLKLCAQGKSARANRQPGGLRAGFFG